MKNVKTSPAAVAAAVKKATKSVEPKTKTVAVHYTGYDVFSGDDSAAVMGLSEMAKGAYTLASLIVAGMVKVSPKGVITKTKGHSNVFRALSPAGYKKFRTGGNHKHAVLLDLDGEFLGKEQYQLNAAGVKFLSARNVNEGPAFNTEVKHALAMAEVLRKGGSLQIDGLLTKAVPLTKKVVTIRG